MTTTLKHTENPLTRNLARITGVLALVVVVCAGLFSWRSWHEEKFNSINELNTIMELGSNAVDTYLVGLDRHLSWFEKDLTQTGDRIDLDRAFVLLQRFKEIHPELVNITLFRPDGQILLTAKTPPGSPQPSLAQEPSFIQYRDELQRGRPVSTGRPLTGVVSKMLIVPLRHALRAPNGEPNYILSANLTVEWLQDFWKEAPITKRAALGLMRDDGFLLSRYPVPSQLSLEKIYGEPRTGTLIQHLQQHDFPASGYVEGRSSLDGPQFLTAFRRLSHFPVTLFVAMPQFEIWAAWWSKVQIPYLLTILLLIGGWMAHRVILRRQRAWDEEREVASAALRESEAFATTVLDSLAEHVVVLDAQGTITKVNAAWRRYAEENGAPELARQSVGSSYRDICIAAANFTRGEKGLAAWNGIEAVIAGERNSFDLDYPCDTPEQSRQFHMKVFPLVAPRSGAVIAHEDITERKRMETEIQTALAFQKELLDAIPAPVFYKDFEGRYQKVNRAFTEFFNRSESEVVGKTIHECWPETASLFSAKDQELFQNLGVQIYETQIQNGRGELRDVVYHKATLHHPDGSLRGLVGFMLDITAQKTAEQSLRESEARLQRVLDGTNDGFWDWNVVTEEAWFSRRWAEMLGYDLADIEPHVRSWERLVHPADMPDVQAVLQAHLDGVTPHYRCEHRLRAKNGEWRWIVDRGKVAARDAEGRPLRMSGTHTDITDRKAAELALRAAQRALLAQQDHLEELVAQRTAELAAALDAAEAAGRAKSAFLANMSHEIHTPLNAILGLTHLLRRRAGDPDQSDKLNKIADATRHLLALLDGVLDLARIDADRLVLDRAEFAPETVLHEIHARWIVKAQAKQLDLRLELDPGFARYPVLYGDPNRLAQLLDNYLDNAIKFTERGAVALRGRVLDERAGGVLLRFEVQNEGPGIDPDVLPRLFATFEQADASATRRYGGAGLGLALNRRLARLMGGEVGVESTPGAGNTFWCTVRFDKNATAASGTT